MKKTIGIIAASMLTMPVLSQQDRLKDYTAVTVFQTSKGGDRLRLKETIPFSASVNPESPTVTIIPESTYQEIVGFGGAFTQSSAFVLNQLSAEKKKKILDAYFRSDRAAYSLMRTHINSCDFSVKNYSYDTTADDKELRYFSIAEDMDDLVPLIKEAMGREGASFKIFASPWTAPPWMKDNQAWNNGSLLPEYYPTWALYFSKYIHEYAKQGIPIWGITVENEPENNSGRWETMTYTPASMNEFIKKHLVPQFQKDGLDTKIIIYDHNRDNVKAWADGILSDKETADHVWGTAVHWYSSTIDWYPDVLNYVHQKYPGKEIIHTEGCIDSEIPRWHNDGWYWEKAAKDWGYVWASETDKPQHPPYVPVYRYARDIIGTLNSWSAGWVDWNIVLDTQGGPNHAKNWCIAPVIAKPETDEIYFTPLYYVMAHFSKYFRPGAHRIGVATDLKDLMITACKNPGGMISVAVLNQKEEPVKYQLTIGSKSVLLSIDGNALQTIVIE